MAIRVHAQLLCWMALGAVQVFTPARGRSGQLEMQTVWYQEEGPSSLLLLLGVRSRYAHGMCSTDRGEGAQRQSIYIQRLKQEYRSINRSARGWVREIWNAFRFSSIQRKRTTSNAFTGHSRHKRWVGEGKGEGKEIGVHW